MINPIPSFFKVVLLPDSSNRLNKKIRDDKTSHAKLVLREMKSEEGLRKGLGRVREGGEVKLVSVDVNSLNLWWVFDDGYRRLFRVCGSGVRNFFLPREISGSYLEYVKWKFLHRVFSSAATQLLPVALLRNIRRALPEQVLLRNHRAQLWTVKISKSRGKLYFSEGWRRFRVDNKIHHNDILVFDFDGYEVFDINLFGINTCNKKAGESSVREVENDEHVAETVVVSEEYEESEESAEDEDDDNYDETEENEVETESDEESESNIEIVRKGNQKMAPRSSAGNHKGKELATADNQFRNKGSSSAGPKKGKRVPKTMKSARDEESSDGTEDEADVFKHGIIARPKGPYFVTRLRKRANELYVPADVTKDYNIELGENIIILDERNREWTATVKVWKDKRTWLCKGWRAFRKWNNLKPEDRCLCEFKSERGPRGLYLKITILRAGSWLPRG